MKDENMSFDFDLFVIGGGSGGVRAARIAAGDHGARVAIAEESRFGGTCVIRGCVPKKLMIFASSAPEAAAEMRGYGWKDASEGAFDWSLFHGKLVTELSRLEGLYRSGLVNAGVTIFDQRAKLADAHTIELADGSRVTAKHILIAVGGRPVTPDIPGIELAMISDDLFLMDSMPESVLVIGGGFIACEYATILNGLGAKVTQINRGDAILKGFDRDMTAALAQQLTEIGIDLRMNLQITSLEKTATGIKVTYSDGSTGEFAAVMMATGRSPYVKGLGLEEAGVKLGDRKQIIVDEWSQTSVPSIYAVGDVTDRVNLTPVAIREGHSFADTVFGAKPRKVDHSLIAAAVYTRPHEVAGVGLTEEDAAKKGEVTIFETSFRPMRSLFAGSEARVRMKLVVDTKTDRVLGCHLFGPEAGELIQVLAIPLGMGATKADFDNTVAVHPTLAEEIVTMRQPARTIGGPAK